MSRFSSSSELWQLATSKEWERYSALPGARHPLQIVPRQIAADEVALDRAMKFLDVHGGLIKRVFAALIQVVGQLKINGQLVGYSPLSRVVEIETLMSGIVAKRRLWASLRQVTEHRRELLHGIDLVDLEIRAQRQLEGLGPVHEFAARMAFATPLEAEMADSPIGSTSASGLRPEV